MAWGFGGNDTLIGDAGANALFGGAGDDTLLGFEGDDLLAGGQGSDTLTGGAGEVLYSGNGTVADDPFGDNVLAAADPLHAAYLRGQEGNDDISDSALGDILDGGIGGDNIHLSAGSDVLVVASGLDSNLGSWFSEESARSYDVVDTSSTDAFTFDFGAALHGASSGAMAQPEDGSFEALFVAITTAYNTPPSTPGQAVLMDIEGSQFLIVDDGNGVINGEDLAIQIVGSGSIALDAFGDVVYTPGGTGEAGSGGGDGGIPGG